MHFECIRTKSIQLLQRLHDYVASLVAYWSIYNVCGKLVTQNTTEFSHDIFCNDLNLLLLKLLFSFFFIILLFLLSLHRDKI